MWPQSRSTTRGIFLRTVASCYGMAFISLYTQIPGLYGSNGLSPVHENNDGRGKSFLDKPTLVWTIQMASELSHEHTLDLMCIFGTLLSCLSVFGNGILAGKLIFLLNWILYLSIYHVGGSFLWFQWDILLLEVGFICILLAPFNEDGKSRPWDRLNMECVRWLLFRMMFANGVVKLTSECPSWWGLKAMPLHYESQCIPTPVSWFAFNYLPPQFHQFSVAMTFLIEIPMTFLFYAPTVGLRKFAYSQQIVLMIIIMITGNYNFFNLLFMGLCISLSDDSWWRRDSQKKSNILVRFLIGFFNVCVIGILFFLFSINFMNSQFNFEIQFDLNDLKNFLSEAIPIGIKIGGFFFLMSILEMLLLIFYSFKDGILMLLKNLFCGFWYILIATTIFYHSISVFVNGIDGVEVPQEVNKIDITFRNHFENLHIINSYGLFRRMTGVGGRPEVVILGSYDKQNWEEYQFLYKPGNLSAMPRYVLPHQPRLDWQMWFIALQGKFHLDRWFVTFCHRLLQGKREVLNLLDRRRNPFDKKSPPKYLKAQLYHYHFTSKIDRTSDKPKQWWFRELIDPEFITVIDEATLQGYLKKMDQSPQVSETPYYVLLKYVLKWLRQKTNEVEPHIVVWTISILFLPTILRVTFGWMI